MGALWDNGGVEVGPKVCSNRRVCTGVDLFSEDLDVRRVGVRGGVAVGENANGVVEGVGEALSIIVGNVGRPYEVCNSLWPGDSLLKT